jgi:hypothetical protein
MKKDNFITYVLLGVGALGILYYFKNRKKRVKPITQGELVTAVIKEEEDKYSTPFVNEYKIVMPSDVISKRVREKSAKLRAGRFAIQEEKIQNPLYL